MRSKRYFYFSQLAVGATLGGCIGSALAGGRWYDYALIPALSPLRYSALRYGTGIVKTKYALHCAV